MASFPAAQRLLHAHTFRSCSPLTNRPAISSLSYKPLSFSSSMTGFGQVGIAIELKDRGSFVQTAAVRHLMGSLTRAEGLRFAVVVARFNEIVTKLLLEGALETFKRYSVKEEDIDVVWVPGSFEIGVVAERLGKSKKYQAILCIGAVIRGDTSHYDAVANSAASGVLSAGLNSGVPCIFGVLTCDDMDQALNRSGGKSGNKGAEAALTAADLKASYSYQITRLASGRSSLVASFVLEFWRSSFTVKQWMVLIRISQNSNCWSQCWRIFLMNFVSVIVQF